MKIRDFFFRITLLCFACQGFFLSTYSQTISDTFLYESHENEKPVKSSTINLPDGYKIVVKDNLYSIIDQNAKTINAIAYKKVGWANGSNNLVNGYIGYKNNDLWGLLHLKSTKTTSPNYTSVIPYEENLIIASKREDNTVRRNFGVINTNEKVIIPFRYNFLAPAEVQLIAAKSVDSKNRYGLINKKEGTIIPFIYERISALAGGQLSVVNNENKAALFSNEGVQLTPFEFDSILYLDDHRHLIDKTGKKGVINSQGKVVVDPIYKKITKNTSGLLQGLPFSHWDLLTADNRLLQNLEYDTIAVINKSLLKATIGGYEYIIDHKDHPVTKLEKRKFGRFTNGYCTFKENGKYGAIANYGELIIPPVYDHIAQYNDFFVTRKQVSQNHQWSIFNGDGEKINKISYDQIGEWSDGYFSVKKNGLWGFVNEYGHEVIKAKFDSVFDFNQGVARVYHKDKYAVIDKFGRYVVPLDYHMVDIINPNIFLVKSYFNFAIYKRDQGEVYQSYYQLYKDKGFIVEKTNSDKVGLFDPNGQRILISQYDYIKVALADQLHVFGKEEKMGLLNREGGILLSLEDGLKEVKFVGEGFIGVKLNRKYGFIDFNGKLRVANRYDSIGNYCESMAPIKLLGKWGYIDKIERLKIQPKFEYAGSFKNETAIVGRKNRYGIIDKSGKELVKIAYEKIIRNKFGNYQTISGKKVGLVRGDGFEVIFPKYESVTDLGNGYIIVGNYGKFGVINEKGVSTIPVKYEKLHYNPGSDLFFGLKAADWENITVSK